MSVQEGGGHVPTGHSHEAHEEDVSECYQEQKNAPVPWQEGAVAVDKEKTRLRGTGGGHRAEQPVAGNGHGEDPQEQTCPQDGVCRLDFEVGQRGATGADGEGLEHTQDTGGAEGQSPHDLVQEDQHFAFDITRNVLHFPDVCGYQRATVRSSTVCVRARWAMGRSMSLGLCHRGGRPGAGRADRCWPRSRPQPAGRRPFLWP